MTCLLDTHTFIISKDKMVRRYQSTGLQVIW
jgi:hypothetical protein